MPIRSCAALVAALVAFPLLARAESPKTCANPSWAPQPIRGFQLKDCDGRDWAELEVDLPGGSKELQGKETLVWYSLANDKEDHSAAEVRSAALAMAQKAGGKLVSSPRNGFAFVANAGNIWFIYDHGGGNDEHTSGYKLTTLEERPLPQEIVARPMTGVLDVSNAKCDDPPWLVKQFSTFKRDHCEAKAWGTETAYLKDGAKTVEGRLLSVRYSLEDNAPRVVPLAIQLNVVRALTKIGATLLTKPDNASNAVLVADTPAGKTWFFYWAGGGNEWGTGSYTLETIQETPLDQEVQARAIPGPLEVGTAKCEDPAWMVKQFPYFQRSRCETKRWDQETLNLASGDQTVEGKRSTVFYTLTDEKKRPVAAAVQKNFVEALTHAGATLMSKPDHLSEAVFHEKTAQGDFWIDYVQGSGNEQSVGGYRVTTWQVAPLEQEVVAKPFHGTLDTSKCEQPAWLVKQFPYFKLGSCENRDFDTVEVDLPDGRKKIAGHVQEVHFTLTDEHQSPTALAVQRNYVQAMQKLGAEQVSRPKDEDRAYFHQKTSDSGELWYLYDHGSGNSESTSSYTLTTIQVGGPAPKACKIEVYGVNFDFDKATLRPDSEPVLTQVLAMFQGTPGFKAEIGGHTDNVGKPAYNQKLSGARADAVKAWLVKHGIAASRITTHGYGDTRPLVPNTSEENRAKNRRVELKRADCRGP